MCPPKIKRQAPAASTTPTMQAADELELITDGLEDNAIGRAALRTSGGARKPASATAAAAATSGASSSAGDSSGSSVDAGTELGIDTPRKPTRKQPFLTTGKP